MKHKLQDVLLNNNEILDRLTIGFEKREVALPNLDQITGRYLYNIILDGDSDRLVIVHPSPEGLFYYLLAVLALAGFKKNLDDESTVVLNNLNPGDLVTVNGTRAEFIGMGEECFAGTKGTYIKLKFADIVQYLPLSKAKGIMPYYGSASTINNYKKKKRESAEIKGYTVLSEIFDTKPEKCERLIRTGIAILCEKTSTINNLKKMTINEVNFCDVFPAGYYKSCEDYEYIGTGTKRVPLLKLCSSVSVLNDIISADKDINTLLVMGTDGLKGWYSSLDFIINKSGIENVVVISDWSYIFNDDFFKNNGFDVLGWNRDNILKYSGDIVGDGRSLQKGTDIFNYHIYRINSYCCTHFDTSIIKTATGNLEELFRRIENLLTQITSYYDGEIRNDSFRDLLNRLFSIYYFLQTLPYPIEYHDCFLKKKKLPGLIIEDALQELDNEVVMSCIYLKDRDILEKMTLLIKYLREITIELKKENPKAKHLLNRVLTGSGFTLVVRKSIQSHILRTWLEKEGIRSEIEILDINQLNRRGARYKKVVFCGWYGKKNASVFYKSIAPNFYFLLYPCEGIWYQRNKQGIERKKAQFKFDFSVNRLSSVAAVGNLEPQWENVIDLSDIFERFTLNDNELQKTGEINDEEDVLVSVIPVFFDDNKYAFFTKQAVIRCVEEDSIYNKKVKDLVPGDEVVFVNDPGDYLLKKIIERHGELNPSFKKKFERQFALSQLWRISLLNYSLENRLTAEEICARLRTFDCIRTTYTVSRWMNSKDIVGPMGNAIEAIAKMTNVKLLLSNVSEVKRACNIVRQVHRNLRNKIYQNVAKSLITPPGDVSVFEPEFRHIADRLPDFADVVTVLKIGEEALKVPMSRTNRLLERN